METLNKLYVQIVPVSVLGTSQVGHRDHSINSCHQDCCRSIYSSAFLNFFFMKAVPCWNENCISWAFGAGSIYGYKYASSSWLLRVYWPVTYGNQVAPVLSLWEVHNSFVSRLSMKQAKFPHIDFLICFIFFCRKERSTEVLAGVSNIQDKKLHYY